MCVCVCVCLCAQLQVGMHSLKKTMDHMQRSDPDSRLHYRHGHYELPLLCTMQGTSVQRRDLVRLYHTVTDEHR